MMEGGPGFAHWVEGWGVREHCPFTESDFVVQFEPVRRFLVLLGDIVLHRKWRKG